jgi:hypothetical protein
LPQQTVLQQIDKSSTVAFTFMSKIILSAKSGSDWTDNELTAFNIQVDTVDSATFFNTVRLPAPNVSPVILTNEARPQGILPKGDRLFFHYMRDAAKGEESSVDDFAAFILGMFNYDEPDRVIHNRKELSFVMCVGISRSWARRDQGRTTWQTNASLIDGLFPFVFLSFIVRNSFVLLSYIL